MHIEEIEDDFDGLLDAITQLVRQLSPSAPPLSEAELQEVLRSPASRLLLARDGTRIVGMLTLAIFRIPTGVRAWIEDVVVDQSARGRGIGDALTRHAIQIAQAHGARTVELTSRPTRQAANRLYTRLGFRPRETTVFRFDAGR